MKAIGQPGGANAVKNDNNGFGDETHGTATITSNKNSTGNIAHGIGKSVPRGGQGAGVEPADILITPISETGAASKWWVSSINTTNFVISVDAAPGTTIAFSWRAHI